jgi:hypothetical protein
MLKVSSGTAIVLALVAIMVSLPSSFAANSSSIEDIIVAQKRYVLYNSRRLSGECLDVCVTKSPTASPTIETGGATPAPTCEDKRDIDVCVAIDNSGSICSVGQPKLCEDCNPNQPCTAGDATGDGMCCGNYRDVATFSKNYINSLNGVGSVSVVKYGSTASVASAQGTAAAAINAIDTKAYSGGYTNTEDAIYQCKNELQGTTNPVIVLVTDGTPTACRRKNGGFKTIFNGDCNEGNCALCPNGDPVTAALTLANEAASAGMSLVPVVINSVSTAVDTLESLARCPTGAAGADCDVNDYKNLSVGTIGDLDTLLEGLIMTTECA